ncbi:hypothetical protein [Thalassotalea fusca]
MSQFNVTNIVFELDWMKILNDAIKLQTNQTSMNEQELTIHRDLCIDAYGYLVSLKQEFSLRSELDVADQIQKCLLSLSKCLMFITQTLDTIKQR